MFSTQLLKPKGLGYPSGRLPGFNPSHPMAVGLNRGYGFSGVANKGNFLSLLTGKSGTLAGTPTYSIHGITGPGFVTTGAADVSTFSGQHTGGNAAGTAAAIIVTPSGLSGSSGFAVVFWSSTTSGTGTAFFFENNTMDIELEGGSGRINSGIALLPNVPYFVAASIGAPNVNFVFRRLDTGAIQTVAVAGTNSVSGSDDGTYQIGNAPVFSQPFGGKISAVMYSPRYFSMASLVQFAYDPWSFWYPYNDIWQFATLSGASSVALFGKVKSSTSSKATFAGNVPVAGRLTADAMARAQAAAKAPLTSLATSQVKVSSPLPTAALALQALATAKTKARNAATGIVGISGRATTAAKALATIGAIGGLTAVSGVLKSMVTARGALTGTVSLSTRAQGQAKASAAGRFTANLLARATTVAKAQLGGTFKGVLFALATVQAKATGAPRGVVGLAGRAVAQGKAFAAISTAASLQAISGVLKAAVTARAAMTAVVPVQAVLGRVGAAVKARAGMSPTAGLVSNLKTAASSRGTVAGRAAMAAVGKVASASFASAAGKVGLSARTASAATARGVSTAFIFLVGAIRSQAKARATSATLRLALTASVKVAATARTQFSRVWLSARTAAATKARGAMSAAFFNLTPVAERTLTFTRKTTLQANRILTLIARW